MSEDMRIDSIELGFRKDNVAVEPIQFACRVTATSACSGNTEVANGMALPVGMTVAARETQTCSRLLAWNADQRRGIKQPDTRAVALRKRGYVAPFPALVRGCDVPLSKWNSASGCKPPSKDKAGGAVIDAEPMWTSTHDARVLLSDWDRFQAMNASVGARLSHGKSGVHGMGVFARLPIKAGDWVVEYQGEARHRLCLHVPWMPSSLRFCPVAVWICAVRLNRVVHTNKVFMQVS